MKTRFVLIVCVVLTVLVTITVSAAVLNESEPNDDPAQANALSPTNIMNAAIDPVGDVDFFSFQGVNITWGFVALLQTDTSTSSQQARLAALGNDGVTVLQEDLGSWEHGSGIALQNYADGGEKHYFRVREDGDDAGVSAYSLRYYSTIVNTQPEVEPNDTRLTANPSGFTHDGVLDSSNDTDCFAFQGRLDDTILLALNGDPEGDGGTADYALSLIDPGDNVLKTVDVSAVAGSEFLEYENLPADGVYAYCVSLAGGSAGAGASYHAGIVRNGYLYFPSYLQRATWLNPPSGNAARIGDTLTFRLAITNTSPLQFPGEVDLQARFAEECLEYLGSDPVPTYTSTDRIEWQGYNPDGLATGEAFDVTLEMRAIDLCADTMTQGTSLRYYFTGTSTKASYFIATPVYLPMIRKD